MGRRRPSAPADAPAAAVQLQGYHQAGGRFTVTGSGDIAPIVAGPGSGAPTATISDHLLGAFAGLLVIVVIAAMFMTAEYRRGLIRITLAASPRRGQVLAAKAIVIGSAAFVTGLVAAVIAVTVGVRLSRDDGSYVLPVPWLTEVRVVAGTAALLAVAAVLALAVGALLRRSAAAITAVIAGIVLPYILATASVLPAGAVEWLLRVTPAAAFAIQQSVPRYPQVIAPYPPVAGYYPLVAVGRLRGAVRVRRGGARPGRLAAAPEGRMSTPAGLLSDNSKKRPAAVQAAARVGVLRAEWTKVRTVPGPAWLLAATAALTIAVSTAAVTATRCPRGLACPVDPARLSLTGIQFGQALVAVLAVLAVSGEYSTGMIRTTLTAVPARTAVLAAKAVVLTGMVLAAAAVAVGGCLLAGRLLLPGHGFTWARGFAPLSLGDGAVLRASVGSVLYLALIGLLALGCAALMRDSAVAIGLVLGLLYLAPIVTAAIASDPVWAWPPRPVRADQRRAHHPGHHRPAPPARRPVGRAGRAGRLGRRGAAGRQPGPAPAGRLTPGRAGWWTM